MAGYFDVAQICLNGHLITDDYNGSPERRKNFCERCGERTLFQCENCNKNIRGEFFFYRLDSRIRGGQFQFHFPYYCDECGSPFPWTTRKLMAIKGLIKDLKITKSEKEFLDKSVEDLIRDTTSSPVAVLKWKKVLGKVEETMYSTIKQLFIDVVSEAVRKSLFGV